MPSTWITFPDGPAQLSVYDANSWQLLNSAENQSASSVSADLTFDPTQNEVYGIFFDGDYSIFWDPSLSFRSRPAQHRNRPQHPHRRLFCRTHGSHSACSADGQLYGISISGDLYAINKTNARTTLISCNRRNPRLRHAVSRDRLQYRQNVLERRLRRLYHRPA